MSKDMISTFRRSGQFILMDATCKTNRFGMPLVLLAGVNEIKKTVILALALIQVEDGESYMWVLQQVQKAIGTVLIDTHFVSHPSLSRMSYVWHTYTTRIS